MQDNSDSSDENDLQFYQYKTVEAEIELQHLLEELNALKNAVNNGVALDDDDEDIASLLAKNIKLKHRLAVLNGAVKEISTESASTSNDMMKSIYNDLNALFATAISTGFSDLTDVPVVIALSGNNPKFGDYQCNSAMPIANIYKQQGKKLPPQEIANKIVGLLPENEIIEKFEIAGPGFINIYLRKALVNETLKNIIKLGVLPPPLKKKLKVVVDFSSPNIAKEMHVGHLRSTIIGDSIARLLEFLGHEVVRINHVGDWGTQFGMLIAHLKDKYPDFTNNMPALEDLQLFYKESKKRFDDDPEFKKRAYECVVKLQSKEEDYIKAWEMICDVSRKEYQKIYDRLDIKLEEVGESFYQSRMKSVVNLLEEKDLLEEDEGRKIMWGDKEIPMTIVKSDGGFTYDTSDMATIRYRIEELNADWIIYVTDAGQATHFQLIFVCAVKAGFLADRNVRLDHVQFGVVLGEDKKKFKTRSGDTVKLIDLLDEGLNRALQKLQEKEREKVLSEEELKQAQESVAYGCIKYADLSHNRIHEYVFSFDKMLEDRGNTAVYLLYAYTRIKSIARNANMNTETIKELVEKNDVSLEHEKEWKLGKVLIRFPDILLKITNDLCLHHLCEYLYEISSAFTEFYDSCYCIEKNSSGDIVKVNIGRILLAEVTAMIMAKGFDILGVKPLSKM